MECLAIKPFLSKVVPRKVEPASAIAPSARHAAFRSVVVAVILGGTILICSLMSNVNSASETGVNLQLPDSLGNYVGFQEDVSDSERAILPKDTEFAKARYIGVAPPEISCEIVLSGSQSQSLHRPQVCLTGQGWAIQGEEPLQIHLSNGRVQKARLLFLARSVGGHPVSGMFLYWYIGKDKTTDNQYERTVITSLDRILKHVNHRWAYAIVSTVNQGDEFGDKQLAQAKQALIAFTEQLAPLIQKPAVNAHPLDRG